MTDRTCVAILTASLALGSLANAAQLAPREVLAQAIRANELRDKGNFAEAEKLYLSVLPEFARIWKPTGTEYAATLNHLGRLYEETGRFQEAEALHEQSLKIREALSKTHPDLVESLKHLGTIYLKTIRLEKAVEFFERSYRMSLERHGETHADVAMALNNLGVTYKELGQYHKAEPLLRRCLEIYRKLHGNNHPEVANALNNLAAVLQDLGRYPEAEKLYRESLELWMRYGKTNPQVGQLHHNLGNLYTAMGEHKRAEEEMKAAVAVREAWFGVEHYRVGNSLNGLASVYASTNRIDLAADTFDRTQRIAHRHIVRVLPNLSEYAQLNFLRFTERNNLWAGLSLNLTRPEPPGLTDRAAEWLLNAKGRSQLCRAQTFLALREAREGGQRKELEQLMEIRRELAQVSLSGAPPTQESAHRNRLRELSEKEQALTRELLQKGATVSVPEWTDRKALQKALPGNACYIDFVRLELFDFAKNEWQSARYAAWITLSAGDSKLVQLGDAQTIDAALLKALREIKGGDETLKAVGEIQAETLVREPLTQLARLILKPLRPHLDKSSHWVISPDGPLWLTPWAALPLDEKTYAVEKHTIQLVISGRDLVPRAPAGGMTTEPVIFADPAFDGDIQETPTGLRGLSRELQLGKIPPLPGSASEAEAITEPMTKRYGKAPRVYLETQATTSNFRSLTRPRALLLSTHGFFLPDSRSINIEDPLLRCGLLLAGCNKPGEAGRAGVLTGREVLSTDLRGCELVVLSACETGLGNALPGEGIAGLRQAFQLAGAEAVLASLWQIPDEQTAIQIEAFVRSLAQGKEGVEALAEAQRSRIAFRREKFGAAHPYYWAAFTLTGSSSKR